MNRTALRGAVAALGVAFVGGCTQQQPAPADRGHVVVAELRGPRVSPGTALDMTVPDATDGQSNHNPPGTVEVFSFAQAVPAEYVDSVNNPCTAPGVYVPVVVKSYATETLRNVQIEFTSISPTSHTVCGDQTGKLTGVTGQIIKYGDLAGSTVTDGTEPGAATSVVWAFNYDTAEPFTFAARVWADVTPSPPDQPSPTSGYYCDALNCPGLTPTGSMQSGPPTLTWRGYTAEALVEISADPTFATTLEAGVVTCSGGPDTYSCSHPVQAESGGTRYWRARNRFLGSGGGTVNGTFYTGGDYVQDAPPTDPAIVTSTNPYYNVVSATSTAPNVDFFSWGWTGTQTWTEPAPYPYSFNSPVVRSGQSFTSEAFDPTGPVTIHWKVCTQYGSPATITLLGACTYGPDRYVP